MSAEREEFEALCRQSFLDVAALSWDAQKEGDKSKSEWLIKIAEATEPLVQALARGIAREAQ